MIKNMAKVKKEDTKDETKEILLDDEEKTIDPELAVADLIPEEDENEESLDDEEADPFKDRWEE